MPSKNILILDKPAEFPETTMCENSTLHKAIQIRDMRRREQKHPMDVRTAVDERFENGNG